MICKPTIALGESSSSVIDKRDRVMTGVILPSALTSVTMTAWASDTPDGTYAQVYDSDGNAVSLTVAASRAVGLEGTEADACAPWPYLKLVGNAAEAAARTLIVCLA